MSNKTAAIIVASMIGITLVGVGVWLSFRSSPQRAPVLSDSNNQNTPAETALPVPVQSKLKPKPKIPAFRVITDKVAYDIPLRSQIEIAAFMEERVTEENLRFLLEHLYELAKKAGPFKFRQHPNYVFIRIYARKGQAHVAMGYETPSNEFDIQIRKELIATINDPPVVRFGLTESERQMIWRDIVRVENRSHREAEDLYPFPMSKRDPGYTETGEKNQKVKQLEYVRELKKLYQVELAESLGLTMDQLEEIGTEGSNNWWETPATRK